jgi:outer membrane protein assembly factor BamB
VKFITVSVLLNLFLLTSCGHFNTTAWMPTGVKPVRPPLQVHWIESLDPSYESGNLPIALQGPAIGEQMLFVLSNRNELKAYDLETNRVLWSVPNQGPFHSSPVVDQDAVVYGSAQGRIFARKVSTGELIYEVDLGGSIETTPLIYEGRALVQLRNHSVVCFDVKTGKILWAYKRSVPFVTTLQRASRPIVHNGKIYVGFADGQVAALGLEDGLLLWEQVVSTGAKFIDVDSSPIIFNGKLLIGAVTGPLLILNPDNGSIIQRLEYALSRPPLISSRGLYLGTTDGELIALDENLREVKKVKLADHGISSMVKWKEKIIVSTVGQEIFVIEPGTYNVVQEFKLGHHHSGIFGNLVNNQDYLVALSSRNRLYIFH